MRSVGVSPHNLRYPRLPLDTEPRRTGRAYNEANALAGPTPERLTTNDQRPQHQRQWVAPSRSAAPSASISASTGAGSSSSSSSPGRSRPACSRASTPAGPTPRSGSAAPSSRSSSSSPSSRTSCRTPSSRTATASPCARITLFVFGGVANLTREPDQRRPRVPDRHRRPAHQPRARRAVRRALGRALPRQRRTRRHLREPRPDQRLARRLQHAARLPARRRPRLPLDHLEAQQGPPARDAHARRRRRVDRLRRHGGRRRGDLPGGLERSLAAAHRLLSAQCLHRQL